MEIIKISFIGIAGIMCALFLKQCKSDYAMYISVATAVIILIFIASKLKTVTDAINMFQKYVDTKGEYLVILLKMIGITYVAEFASSICKDCGYNAIATQIEIFARISLLVISLPVVLALLETISGL
jgi:stage III sporulation protein AD